MTYLIIAGSTPRGERPHDVLVVVDVDIAAHKDKSVDRVADLVGENDVSDTLAKLGWRDLHLGNLGRVELHSRAEFCVA